MGWDREDEWRARGSSPHCYHHCHCQCRYQRITSFSFRGTVLTALSTTHALFVPLHRHFVAPILIPVTPTDTHPSSQLPQERTVFGAKGDVQLMSLAVARDHCSVCVTPHSVTLIGGKGEENSFMQMFFEFLSFSAAP